jgi:rod shape determining protein RodA
MYRLVGLRNFDWLIFLVVCMFLATSFFFVWSASSESFAFKQIIWIGVGVVVFSVLLIVDYYSIGKISYILYLIVLFCLLLVLLFGKTVYGAQRWLMVGPISIQPSEMMKIALVLVLSRCFVDKKSVEGFSAIIFPLALTLLPMTLIMKQPDLGTSLILVPVFFSIMFIAGVKTRYMLTIIAFTLSTIPIFWYFVLHTYQKARIVSFLWPDTVSSWGAGYHRVQSLITIGSGGSFGSGWGKGVQSQLNFLPQGHTDFIFSVIAEEWGFYRAGALLCLYVVFIACCIGIALNTRDPYGRLIVTGFTAMFAAQILINVAMTIGLAPITGLPLPFISYGGSSMISSFIALSFIFNVRMRNRVALAKDGFYE